MSDQATNDVFTDIYNIYISRKRIVVVCISSFRNVSSPVILFY